MSCEDTTKRIEVDGCSKEKADRYGGGSVALIVSFSVYTYELAL